VLEPLEHPLIKLKVAAWIGPVSTMVGVEQPVTSSAARLSVMRNEYFIDGILLFFLVGLV
jgi:hypothetical protein